MYSKIKKFSLALCTVLLVNCGGGTESGTIGSPGATSFTGIWTLFVSLSVNVGGETSFISDTTTINVLADGNVAITGTDSDCTLAITANGNALNYLTSCIFAISTEDVSSACVLTLSTTATFSGDSLFGSFGPGTTVCTGTATSFAGTISGTRGEVDDTSTDDTTTTDTTSDDSST